MPSVPWRVESAENFKKKIRKVSKFQKCPKLLPKVSKRVLNMFWGKRFEKLLPSFPSKVESSKIFKKIKKICKIPKMPKIVPKSIQTCFELVLSQIFRKIFLPSVPWRVEFSKIFKKNIFKIPKMPKSVLKSIQTCFELVLGQIFRKIFLPSVPWRAESSKIFLKIKKFSKIQKCPKSFPKVSKHVLNMFWGKLFENFLPSFPWNVESTKIFKKKCFQNSKNAQKCSQKYPNVF